MLKQLNWVQWIALFVFTSVGGSFIYTVFKVFNTPLKENGAKGGMTWDGDIFLLFEIALSLIILALPSILARRFKLEIPGLIYALFIIFLYGSIYLGTIQKFYDIFPYWDKVVHIFSGVMLGVIGFSFVNLLNTDGRVVTKMKPGFVALFSFCFAVALGALWEIYEFTFDYLMKLNMQRYATLTGKPLLGQAALLDTMTDLIVDVVGSLVVTMIGYFSLKKGYPWMKQFVFKRRQEGK